MFLQAIRQMRETREVRQLFRDTPIEEDVLAFAVQLYTIVKDITDPSVRSSLASAFRTISSCVRAPFLRFADGGAVDGWWSIAELAPSIDEDEEPTERERLCGVVEGAIEALKEWVQARIQSISHTPNPIAIDDLCETLELQDLFSLSLYSDLLIRFEMNNIGFHAPTFFGRLVSEVSELTSDAQIAVRTRVTQPIWTDITQRAANTNGQLEGTGLFAIGCCMNHSCTPNVTLRHKTDPHPHDGRLVAAFAGDSSSSSSPSSASSHPLLDGSAIFVSLRPIAAGEELNISYIDLVRPADPHTATAAEDTATRPGDDARDEEGLLDEIGTAERQRALRGYGFTCACDKCRR